MKLFEILGNILRAQQNAALLRSRKDPITVQLTSVGREEMTTRLPLHLRREDLSRAEVLGRIGMLPMREPGKRFSLKFLATGAFLIELEMLKGGEGDVLSIPALEEEIDQFDLEKFS